MGRDRAVAAAPPPQPTGGRPFVPDRAGLTGILCVLRSGIPWELLPRELGCGCGMTCWRRRRAWQAAGVWGAVHRVLPDRLGEAGRIDWRRAAIDSARCAGSGRRPAHRAQPTDRGRAGTTHRLLVERGGVPLAARQSAATVPDAAGLAAVVDAAPPIRRPRGRPHRRPAKLPADQADNAAEHRRALRRRPIAPRVARRGVESSERVGRHRWAVERTLVWRHRFRRRRIRDERRDDIQQASPTLGAALIAWNFVERLC